MSDVIREIENVRNVKTVCELTFTYLTHMY